MFELKVICVFCHRLQKLNVTLDPQVPLKDGGGIYNCDCGGFLGELDEVKE